MSTFFSAELSNTTTYTPIQLDEKAVVTQHIADLSSYKVELSDNQGKLPTMYWIPKLHKSPNKSRFIANSSACTTTNLFQTFNIMSFSHKGTYNSLLF